VEEHDFLTGIDFSGPEELFLARFFCPLKTEGKGRRVDRQEPAPFESSCVNAPRGRAI
jgi:hypothetical protein